jgi:hypothetical protein
MVPMSSKSKLLFGLLFAESNFGLVFKLNLGLGFEPEFGLDLGLGVGLDLGPSFGDDGADGEGDDVAEIEDVDASGGLRYISFASAPIRRNDLEPIL